MQLSFLEERIRRRAERERREREAMEREERRTRKNINAERAEKLLEERRANALRLQEEVPRETNNVETLPLQEEEYDEGEHSLMTRFPTGWVMTRSPDEMLEALYQERQRNAAVAARMARDNEILMTTDQWKSAKERAQEAFNERRRSAIRERASSSSSSSVPKKIKKGYKYEEVPVETPEIETSRSRRRRERDARLEDAEMEAAIKAVADEEAVEALFELSRRNRGGKRNTRRVRKSKKMKKRINRSKSRK